MDLPASPSLDKLAHDSALRKDRYPRREQDTGLTPASLINMARIEYAKRAYAPGIYRRRRLSGWLCRSEPFP